jgi:protease-4
VKKGMIVGLAVLVLVSLVVLVLLGTRGGEKIAVIPLSGTIAGGAQAELSASPQGITPELVRSYLEKAKQDSKVKAVVLRINSPGGSAAACQEIAEMIKDFKVDTGKPVVVSMGDVAASGGYYISVYADEIWANESTMTGSIGVILQIASINRDRFLEVTGIDVRIIASPEDGYKDLSQVSDEELKEMYQPLCDEVYEQFIKTVADGRGLSKEYVGTIATGASFTGSQAKYYKLVDELGGLDEAIDRAAELADVKAPTVEWYGSSSPVGRLLGLVAKAERFLEIKPSDDQLLFLRMLEGWQAVPRYQS